MIKLTKVEVASFVYINSHSHFSLFVQLCLLRSTAAHSAKPRWQIMIQKSVFPQFLFLVATHYLGPASFNREYCPGKQNQNDISISQPSMTLFPSSPTTECRIGNSVLLPSSWSSPPKRTSKIANKHMLSERPFRELEILIKFVNLP